MLLQRCQERGKLPAIAWKTGTKSALSGRRRSDAEHGLE
jgi:hypothetical protein